MKWLVLEDFAGDIKVNGVRIEIVGSGTVVEDGEWDVEGMRAQGCPMVRYNERTMGEGVRQFQAQGAGVPSVASDGNLISILVGSGALPVYEPREARDWIEAPETMAEALDEIARRLKACERLLLGYSQSDVLRLPRG